MLLVSLRSLEWRSLVVYTAVCFGIYSAIVLSGYGAIWSKNVPMWQSVYIATCWTLFAIFKGLGDLMIPSKSRAKLLGLGRLKILPELVLAIVWVAHVVAAIITYQISPNHDQLADFFVEQIILVGRVSPFVWAFLMVVRSRYEVLPGGIVTFDHRVFYPGEEFCRVPLTGKGYQSTTSEITFEYPIKLTFKEVVITVCPTINLRRDFRTAYARQVRQLGIAFDRNCQEGIVQALQQVVQGEPLVDFVQGRQVVLSETIDGVPVIAALYLVGDLSVSNVRYE